MALPDAPLTRNEIYLSNIAGQGTTLPEAPITREEMYLDYIAKNGGGGGGGGTTNYTDLSNKPQINGNTLTGNKTGADLGLAPTEVTISTAGDVTQAIDAEKIYHFTGDLTALSITLNAPASGDLAQYHFDFLSGSAAPSLTLPNTVIMPDSFTVEANRRYEVDILNNYGAVVSWTNS